MDYALELRYQSLVKSLQENFGPGIDLQVILFLIGVEELGQGYKKFKKHEKTDLMHVAICTVLEPYGYYKYEGNDEQNWPHYSLVKELPPLDEAEQQTLMKEAIVEYFEHHGYSTKHLQP
jgi:hypothetical protein